MRFKFDRAKSHALLKNPKRGISLEEAQKVWLLPHFLDQRSMLPQQWRAIGWVDGRLFTVIFEEREDDQGEYVHLVTLWRSSPEERRLYEENI